MNDIPLGDAAWLDGLFANELFIFRAAYLIVCGLSLLFLAIALAKRLKKKWDSAFFIWLCGAVFGWALLSFLSVWLSGPAAEAMAGLRMTGLYFVPALLCLHTWRQVYYKTIPPGGYVLAFCVPGLLTAFLVYNVYTGGALAAWEFLAYAVFFLYAFVAVIRSYLLCFNVFYQMPRHMRRTTHALLLGISMLAAYLAGKLIWDNTSVLHGAGQVWAFLATLAVPVLFAILASALFDGFFVTPSNDVIVTSRDFVFGSLSTVILILNDNMRILDWNKKGKKNMVSLPPPKYKESMEHYRFRLIEDCGGRVSPHDENIITITKGEEETHYLFTTHDIGYEKRQFGHLVEIANVTTIYSILRILEESAMRDQFTSLYNRNAYIEYVRKLRPEQFPLSIMVGDVNFLKQINDTHGHLVGDQLLADVAGAVKKHMPPGSFSARIGGDEFAVLVPGGSDEIARRFIEETEVSCAAIYNATYGTPSVSWGYALMKTPDENYNEVFQRADAMMYEKKKSNFRFSSSGIVPEEKG